MKRNQNGIVLRRKENKRKTKPQTSSFSVLTKQNQKTHLTIEDDYTTTNRAFYDGILSSQIVKSHRKKTICADMWSLTNRR